MGRLLERKLHDVETKGITVPVVAVLLEFNVIEVPPVGQKTRLKISHPNSSSGALLHERLSEVFGQVGIFEDIIVNRFDVPLVVDFLAGDPENDRFLGGQVRRTKFRIGKGSCRGIG